MKVPTRLDSLVPLTERHRWNTALRVVLILAPLGLWAWDAPHRSGPFSSLAIPAAVLAVFTACSVLLPKLGRGAVRTALAAGGLLDGAWLVWALHVDGGLSGGVFPLILCQITAVTLLNSFRTGIKVAVWDALLGLLLFDSEQSGLLPVSGPAPHTPDILTYVAFACAIALAVASFAAVNERELRRRRYDAEALHLFSGTVQAAANAAEVAAALVSLGGDDLCAKQALVLVEPNYRPGRAPVIAPFAAVWPERPVEAPPGPGLLDAGLAARAFDGGAVVIAPALGDGDDALRALMGDVANVAVIPFDLTVGARGVLVLAFEPPRFGPPRIERRALSTARQATAHAALALDRAYFVGRLENEARRDPLTGLANRRRLEHLLKLELAAASAQWPLAVVLIDLDHFKNLNDTFGHEVGDRVLQATAAALATECGHGAVAGRWGGEEFLVVSPRTTLEGALVLAERLRTAIANCSPGTQLTASLGVAVAWEPKQRAALLRNADRAMYRAKKAGRNQVAVGDAPGAILGPEELLDSPS
ncbi:MAG TPA: diguanylate cyclase [Acidimicrobiales bacterium]|nr:diguanylate cyclase [Acidimicrobiales bacterium]